MTAHLAIGACRIAPAHKEDVPRVLRRAARPRCPAPGAAPSRAAWPGLLKNRCDTYFLTAPSTFSSPGTFSFRPNNSRCPLFFFSFLSLFSFFFFLTWRRESVRVAIAASWGDDARVLPSSSQGAAPLPRPTETLAAKDPAPYLNAIRLPTLFLLRSKLGPRPSIP